RFGAVEAVDAVAEAEEVVEGTVLEHEDDEVLDLREGVAGHGGGLCGRGDCGSGNEERSATGGGPPPPPPPHPPPRPPHSPPPVPGPPPPSLSLRRRRDPRPRDPGPLRRSAGRDLRFRDPISELRLEDRFHLLRDVGPRIDHPRTLRQGLDVRVVAPRLRCDD